jgi:hypothetical protein
MALALSAPAPALAPALVPALGLVRPDLTALG